MKAYTGERLPLGREICFSGGNFTTGIFGTIMGTWLTFFYVDKLGFNTKAIGYAMIIYSIWNMVNDPLMGLLSDKTHTRLGRRLPYVLFGAIPMAVAFFFIFSPPTNYLTSQTSQILYYTLSLCVYDFFFTTVLLNWEAVIPDMYPKEKDRGRIIGIAQVLEIVSTIIATLAVQPIFEKYGWTVMAAIFGVIGGITMLLTVFGISENPKSAEVKPLGIIESFKFTFRSKSFIICAFSVLFMEVARGVLMAAIPFYGQYVFPDVEYAATAISAAVFIPGLIYVPVILFISKRKGVKFTYCLSIIALAVVCCSFFFIKNFIAFVILGALAGFGVMGGVLMPKLLNTQIIDEDQTVSGRRREGAFYGIYAFIIRFSGALQSVVLTQTLSASGYVSQAKTQSASALTGMHLLMSFIPVAFMALAFLLAKAYPLYGEQLAAVNKKLAELKEQNNDYEQATLPGVTLKT